MIRPTAFVPLAIALMLQAVPAAFASGEQPFPDLVAARSPSLVTVKFVLKIKMGGAMSAMGDTEAEQETTGAVVSRDGLVLCSNTQLSGMVGMMRRMIGSMGDVTATPSDLKVLIGDDHEGVDAELIARDTELDLAWIRIREPRSEGYDHVDFSQAGVCAVGDTVRGVRRMAKYFDRVPVVSEARVAAVTKKPRTLLVPSAALGTLGLPVYDGDGRVIGVSVLQVPDAEDTDGNPMAMLSNLSSMEDVMSGLILPADEVVKATQRALESAASRPADDPADGESAESGSGEKTP